MKNKKENTFTFNQHINIFMRGFRLLSSFSKSFIISQVISVIFDAPIPFINIYFSALILNELSGDKNKNRLIFLVLLTIGLNLLSMLIRSIIGRWSAYCSTSQGYSIHKIYNDKLLSMDYVDIENPEIQRNYFEILEHDDMEWGLVRLSSMYSNLISGVIQITLSIIMALSLFTLKVPFGSKFSYLDSPFAILIFIFLLFCSIFVAPYLLKIGSGKLSVKTSNEYYKSIRIFYFYFFEMISGNYRAKDIRIYDQKKLINKGTALYELEFLNNWQKKLKYKAKYSAFSTGISYLSNGLIYLYVVMKVFAGAFGVGGIVQYFGAITQFSGGLASIITNIGILINNNAFLDKAIKFLDIPNNKYKGLCEIEKYDDIKYTIEFHNVSFKYPGTDTYVLKNINLKLNIGERLAVVGMNGSGKTTMIKLLCRLYDPTDGIITLNGVDIKEYNYDEYLELYSVVFQDFKLLPFTLSQNVSTNIKYDEKIILQVLAKSGFDLYHNNMPKGIETYLYKNIENEGIEISSGEAQKIALARALYKNTPFIVLDEPTAALDPIAEFEIYSRFNEIIDNKTAIYISHRLSSCRFCNDIIVFHEGELIQRGNHDILVADKKGKYYELWNAQAQYYAENKEA